MQFLTLRISKYTCIELSNKSSLWWQHIEDIVKSLHKNKIKISAAFARQRIEHCATSLEDILPVDEQKRWQHAAKHPVYVRINTLLTERTQVMDSLEVQVVLHGSIDKTGLFTPPYYNPKLQGFFIG